MTNMQAAVGVAQLEKLDGFIKKKRQIAAWYSEELKGLEKKGQVKLHPEMPWAGCVYWMYSILLTHNFGVSRDQFIKKLAESGIETRQFFYPVHLMPPYYKGKGHFPIAEDLSKKGLSLPSGVKLNKKEIGEIVKGIREAISSKRG